MEKSSFDALSARISVAETLVNYLQGGGSKMESRNRNPDLVGGRMVDVEHLRKSLEKRLGDLEKREKEFDAFEEGEKRKLAFEEKELTLKRQKFVRSEEVLDEHLVSVTEDVEWLGLAQAEVEGIRRRARKKLKGIESREENLRRAEESMAERKRKVDLIIGTLDERINAVEEREKEFNRYLEAKMSEMGVKEDRLRVKWEEFVEQVKLVDEKIREQEKLKNGLTGRLELAENKLEATRAKMDERLKEIEFRENAVAGSVKEADLIRQLVEKQLEEFEKMRSEFDSFQQDKMRELDSKEQQLNAMSEELVKSAKLRNEQLITKERWLHKLLKRLKLAKDDVEGLKNLVDERFKKIGLKEIEVNSTGDWLEGKMEEVDFKAKELEEKEKRIKTNEENVMYKKNKLKEKKKELELKEETLWAWQKDLEVKQKEVDSAQQLNVQRLEKLDVREKGLKEFAGNCFKRHQAIKRKLQFEKDLVEKVARFLGLNLEHALRELEFEEKHMTDHVEELELKQQGSTDNFNALVKIEPDESVDLEFTVRMDGKNLQMFLTDPEKDLESMGDAIFKVLHLSSDPAKLVLDAMVGFYPPHLRKGDVTFDVRRTCVTLLQQLIKMSKKIKPHVREEAIELATAWRSKMRGTAENPNSLEVLGFLLLLAAYNLASCFDKDEISSLLMMVVQHRETSELYRVLGFLESRTVMQPSKFFDMMKCDVPELVGDNYRVWKERILLHLRCMGIDYAIWKDEPVIAVESSSKDLPLHEHWERSNRLSLMFIKTKISGSIRGSIERHTNVKALLKAIKEQFEILDKALVSNLIVKFTSTRLTTVRGVFKHIMKLRDIAAQLKILEIEMSEAFLVHYILTTLPSAYGPLKISYNTHKEKWSINELMTKCVKEEGRLIMEMGENVLTKMQGKDQKLGKPKGKCKIPPQGGIKKESKELKCFFCKKGHMKKDCSKFQNWLEKKGYVKPKEANTK